MALKQSESPINDCWHLSHWVYLLEFRGQVLALEQIHRDLLEIDPVHSAEDDYGPAGLRPAVGVHLEQRLHGGAAS